MHLFVKYATDRIRHINLEIFFIYRTQNFSWKTKINIADNKKSIQRK